MNEPPRARAAHFVRHHGTVVWSSYAVGALVLAAAAALFVTAFSPGSNIAVFALLMISVAAAGLLIMRLENAHDRRLCEACIKELPLSPGDAALKQDRRLRAVHWTVDHQLAYRLSIGLYIAALVISLVFRNLEMYLATAALGSTGLAVLLTLNTAFTAHRKYGPWCPYCPRGGGGGSLHMPAPEPTDSTSRRR